MGQGGKGGRGALGGYGLPGEGAGKETLDMVIVCGG